MTCYLHPETQAVSFCRACGRGLCAVCQRPSEGTLYCQDHVPAAAFTAGSTGPSYSAGSYTAGASAGSAPPPPGSAPYGAPYEPGAASSAPNPYTHPGGAGFRTSPAIAFILGFIPGVGAIYNGQYLKGLAHAIIFGLLVSIISQSEGGTQPFLGVLIAAFCFYMPFEALHTAKRRQMGVPVDEWSSLMGHQRYRSRLPIGPVLLILFGVLFLLDTLHLIEFREVTRYWPLLLIAIGVYSLYSRVTYSRPPLPPYEPPTTPGQGMPDNSVIGMRHD